MFLELPLQQLLTSKKIKRTKITELDASQTARSLSSVDAAVVNNTFVTEAKLDYKKALFKESKLMKTQNNGTISSLRKKIGKHHLRLMLSKKIIAAYHTDDDVKKLSKHQTVWTNQFGNKKHGEVGEKIPPLALYRAWIVRKSSS